MQNNNYANIGCDNNPKTLQNIFPEQLMPKCFSVKHFQNVVAQNGLKSSYPDKYLCYLVFPLEKVQ